MKKLQLATSTCELLLCVIISVAPCAAQQAEPVLAKTDESAALPDAVTPVAPCAAQQAEPVLAKTDESAALPDAVKAPMPISEHPPYLMGEAAMVHNVPSTPRREKKAGFWTGRTFSDPPLRTNLEILHDKTWIGVQAFWLGSIVYDAELTHQGLAHHKCLEIGSENPRPSRADLYKGHIPEYAIGTALNFLAMKYISKGLMLEFPGIASTKHLRAGSRWITNCW